MRGETRNQPHTIRNRLLGNSWKSLPVKVEHGYDPINKIQISNKISNIILNEIEQWNAEDATKLYSNWKDSKYDTKIGRKTQNLTNIPSLLIYRYPLDFNITKYL